jgi:alpha-glucosidase (family GH31 glycosyl hydrolase)
MSENVSTFLHHQPFGKHHPYDQEPEERFPREPIAGEPVILGVKTGSGSTFEALWAVWRIAGSIIDHRVEGKIIETAGEYILWHIELPPFEQGAKIQYRIFARGNGFEEQTEWFVFAVSTWIEYRQILSVTQNDQEIVILLGSEKGNAPVRFTLLREESGTIYLHISQAALADQAVPKPHQGHLFNYKLEDATIALEQNPFALTITRAGYAFELKTSGFLRALLDTYGRITRYQLAFNSPNEEAFYGFGERYNALDQRGNSLMNRVIDQYKRQGKRTYYPVPFFISSRGYGLWVKTDREITFDLAETSANVWQINSETNSDHGDLEIIFLLQGNPHHIIGEFTRLTGRPKMPPSWVFGLWMSSNDWNSQAEVLKQFNLTRQHKIAATVLVIEAWADEVNFYIWNDAQYKLKTGADAFKYSDFNFPKEGHWPDPKAMVDTLHASGTRLILWQNPTLKQSLPEENLDERQNRIDEQYLIKNRLCVMEENGEPYRVLSPWFYGSLLADFTNPETDKWWFKQREYLVKEMGIDGFKTDGGEHIWSRTVKFSDGTTGKGRCNSFPYLYLRAYDRFLEVERGKDRFLFSRAGFTGAQNHPGHWAGDEDSNWEAFRSSLYAMMSIGMSGEPFVGWDIAGFGGEPPSAELYIRAAAFSVFCPIMQYHSEYNARLLPSRDRTPWNIQERSDDQQVIPLFRKLTNLRMNLLPFIQYQAWRSCQTGLPLMRALPIEFPEDVSVKSYPFEYLFGEALLAAPVVEEGKDDWLVYLPAGKWRDFWTQVELRGPQVLTVNVPRDCIPVYQREGSIVALNLGESFELSSDVGNQTEVYQNLALHVFPGEGCQFDLVRNQGERLDRITVLREDDPACLQIELPAVDCPLELTVYMSEPDAVTHNGVEIEWQWDDVRKLVKFQLKAENKKRLIKIF